MSRISVISCGTNSKNYSSEETTKLKAIGRLDEAFETVKLVKAL